MKTARQRLGSSCLICITLATSTACVAEEATTIPVVINILKNSGVSEDDAKKAVQEASKILKDQANIKLTQVKINKDVTVPPDTDAELTGPERTKVREAGGKEIQTLDNKKGLKITFAKDAKIGGGPGVSVHRNPTLIVEKRSADNGHQSGIIIAHEIAHILTLGPGHKIDDTTNADRGGHSSSADNLMNPVEPPGGNTKLTAAQVAGIRKDLGLFGKTVQIDPQTPGKKKEQQYGAATDSLQDIGDGVGAYLDLFRIMMASEIGNDTINTALSLGGLYPDTDDFNSTYRLFFDTDNDTQTGIDEAGFFGVDREVRVDVGRGELGGPLATSGFVIDYALELQTPLPSAPLREREPELDDGLLDVEEQILLGIPKSLLEITALEIPVGIASMNGGGVEDFVSTVFEFDRFEKDTTFALNQASIEPGESLAFEISGLLPNSVFDFYVDEELSFSETLSPNGDFSGKFTFPDLPLGELYFLTAQDSTGEFAFNAIFAVPGGACDFDGSGSCGFSDINLLMAQGNLTVGVPVTSGTSQFDLNNDHTLNEADITEWLGEASTSRGYSSAFHRGDTDNLEDDFDPTVGTRTVDITDFQNFLTGFTGADLTWEAGNFNGDDVVDITDFSNHFLPSFAATSGGTYGPGQSIPEPGTVLLLGIGGVLLGYFFGRESLAM